MIYLDHAASTPLSPRALEFLKVHGSESFANPSSAHRLGRQISEEVDNFRRFILELLELNPQDWRIVFTSSATEANNLLIQGLELSSGSRIWASPADHPSLWAPAKFRTLQTQNLQLLPIPLEQGWLSGESWLQGLLTQSESGSEDLAIFSHINNSSGHWQDLEHWIPKARQVCPRLHVHVDAVQSFGKVPFRQKDWCFDSLTLCGHKMGGPKGVGALVIKKSAQIRPLLLGGGQEEGLRSSTVNALGLLSWKASIEDLVEDGQSFGKSPPRWGAILESHRAHVENLNLVFRRTLESLNGIHFLWPKAGFKKGELSPYILLFHCEKVPSGILMRHLEQKKIYLSSSSACSSAHTSAGKKRNEVYAALGIPEAFHSELLRVSFAHDLTESDVREAACSLQSCYGYLRKIYVNESSCYGSML